MNALDYILDGLEAELSLERELGVRVIEIDRELLKANNVPLPMPVVTESPPQKEELPVRREVKSAEIRDNGKYDFVFLHEKPLSEKGFEMMRKIIGAMGKTMDTAPIITEMSEIPRAKVFIVLGSGAMRKFLPGQRGAPGMWLKTPKGADAFISNSPEQILRFGAATLAVKKIKEDMWRGLKGVMQRINSQSL